jgi:hypothetical protein
MLTAVLARWLGRSWSLQAPGLRYTHITHSQSSALTCLITNLSSLCLPMATLSSRAWTTQFGQLFKLELLLPKTHNPLHLRHTDIDSLLYYIKSKCPFPIYKNKNNAAMFMVGCWLIYSQPVSFQRTTLLTFNYLPSTTYIERTVGLN